MGANLSDAFAYLWQVFMSELVKKICPQTFCFVYIFQ